MYKLELAKAQAEYEFLLGEVENKRLMEQSSAQCGKHTIQRLIGRLTAKMTQGSAQPERNRPV